MSAPLPRLRLTLASKSPARLATLRSAGFDPRVEVSEVDEDALLAGVLGGPGQRVLALATAKARDVAGRPSSPDAAGRAETGLAGSFAESGPGPGVDAHAVLLGCDSMFEFDGEIVGKPQGPQVARERLARMSGRSGVLHTGHCLLHPASGATLGAVSRAVVHVAPLSAAEIDAYVDTGEPLRVAGSFTVDGFAGPFIDRVDGDHHGVVGVSLPLLRRMLSHWGMSVTQFWERPARGEVTGMGRRILGASTRHSPRHGADAFIACSCGSIHWGLAGAGGVLAFRERDGIQVLAQLRSERTHSGGTWSIPGGAIEWSETPVEGALREFHEETRIGADELEVVGTHVDDHGDWAYSTFVAHCPEAEPMPDGESLELRWVALDDLLTGRFEEPLHPGFAKALPSLARIVGNRTRAV